MTRTMVSVPPDGRVRPLATPRRAAPRLRMGRTIQPLARPTTTRSSCRGAEEVPLKGTALRAPVRTCIGCRTARPKDELLRIARTPTGVRFDPDVRLPGRGAYVCPDPTCVASARRRDGATLRRALRGAGVAEVDAAMDQLSAAVQYQVPDSTVRSENA